MWRCRSGRHRRQRLQQSGEAARVGAHQGIGGIGHVERDRPVVGVHGRLHRVADVVAHPAHRLRVRIAVGRGVAVHHPHQAAVIGDDQVRVAGRTRRTARCAAGAASPCGLRMPRLRREVVGEDDLGLAETPAKAAAGPTSDRDPAAPLVARVTRSGPRADSRSPASGADQHVVRAVSPRSRTLIAGTVVELGDVLTRLPAPHDCGSTEPLPHATVAVRVRSRCCRFDPDCAALQMLYASSRGESILRRVSTVDYVLVRTPRRSSTIRAAPERVHALRGAAAGPDHLVGPAGWLAARFGEPKIILSEDLTRSRAS